jgi:hypothetical protein
MSLLTLLDKIANVKRCQNCLITSKCPKTVIGEDNICNYCKEGEKKNPNDKHSLSFEEKAPYREDMDKTFNTIKGKGRYDVLLGFSGGKDSTYLLYKLKQTYPHLRILPVTIDMSFLSKTAFENITRIINKLNMDHVFIKVNSGFYKKFFKYLFEHRKPGGYKAVSYMADEMTEERKGFCDYCHGFNDGQLIRYAYENKIPLVVTGASPGQPFYLFYELAKQDLAKYAVPEFIYHEPFDERDRSYFWEASKFQDDPDFPRVIFPYHVIEYNGEKIRQELVAADLILDYKKTSPAATNCSLNFVMTYIDFMIDEYFIMLPYAARQIRKGELDKKEWSIRFRILELILRNAHIMLKRGRMNPTVRKVKEVEKILGISVEEIVEKHMYQKGKLNF